MKKVLHFKVPEIFLHNTSPPEVSRIRNICWNDETKKLWYDFLKKRTRERYKRMKQRVRGIFIIGKVRILTLCVANTSFWSLNLLVFHMLNVSSLTATLEYFGGRTSQLPPLTLFRPFYSYSKPFLSHLKFDESL